MATTASQQWKLLAQQLTESVRCNDQQQRQQLLDEVHATVMRLETALSGGSGSISEWRQIVKAKVTGRLRLN